jgi:hypothetical protein
MKNFIKSFLTNNDIILILLYSITFFLLWNDYSKYIPITSFINITFFITVWSFSFLIFKKFNLKILLISYILSEVGTSIDILDIIYEYTPIFLKGKSKFSGVLTLYFNSLIFISLTFILFKNKFKEKDRIFITLLIFMSTVVIMVFHTFFLKIFKNDMQYNIKNYYEKIVILDDSTFIKTCNDLKLNCYIKYKNEDNYKIYNYLLKNPLLMNKSQIDSYKSVLDFNNKNILHSWYVVEFENEKINRSYSYSLFINNFKEHLIIKYQSEFGENVYKLFQIMHIILTFWFFLIIVLILKHKKRGENENI